MKRIKRAKIKLNKHENTMTVLCDTSTTNQRIRYTEIISGIAVCANEHNCNKFLREHIACIHRYKTSVHPALQRNEPEMQDTRQDDDRDVQCGVY